MEIYKNLDLNDLPNEIWLPIEGYEGLYVVSNMGRVKSLGNDKSRKDKILSQGKLKNGYLVVNLNKDKKSKTCYVHRLVCQAFIDNPNCYRCVNHKDENPLNNCVDNLEWCTYQYNLNYKNTQQRRVASTDFKAIVEKRKIDYKAIAAKKDYKAIAAKIDYKAIAEKKSKRVYQYSKDGTLVAIYQSSSEADRNGFNQGNVSKCCRNCFNREGNNVYKNYIWSYTPIDSK